MTTLSRYVSFTLIKSTLLILLVFVGLEIFILLATQLNALGKGSFNIWQAILYVLLVLPQQTYLLFPMAGLLGILFGFSWLSNHGEVIVMRVSGVSPLQLVRFALHAGIILVIAITLIGEVIGPTAKSLAEKRKLIATSMGQALKTRQGLWLRQGDNFYYIKTIYSAHHIADISRYTFNGQQLTKTSLAKEGHYEDGIWQMSDVSESHISSTKVTSNFISDATWDLAVNPHLLKISQSMPEEMSLSQLNDLINYQKENHLTGNNFQIAFWQRIFQPLSSVVMMFLAIPFIFGPLRSVTTSLRLVLGVMVGFSFYLCNQLFPPLSQVLDFPPIIAASLPTLLFAFLGLMLMRRVK